MMLLDKTLHKIRMTRDNVIEYLKNKLNITLYSLGDYSILKSEK